MGRPVWLFRPAARAQNRGLKVHISVDMEGVAGVVAGDQLGPQGFESRPDLAP